MRDLVTLGEAMIVFIAENKGEFSEIEKFSKGIAGAELNVSIGLSRLGHKVSYITRLGDDVFGSHIKESIDKEEIGAEDIYVDENCSTGFYFKTKVPNGDVQVDYFRKNTAATNMCRRNIEDANFGGARILHITGITAALSNNTLDAIYAAIEKARKNNMFISFDPNIRTQLWESKEKMITVLNDLASKCDLVLPGIREGRILTGKETKEDIAKFYLDAGAKIVVVKDGASGCYLRTAAEENVIPGFKVSRVVDTIGAGDGFATGVLSGLLDGQSYEEALTRGNAIGALMVTSKEDNAILPTKEELQMFIDSHERY